MKKPTFSTIVFLIVSFLLVSCSPAVSTDDQLKQNIEAALIAGSDLPQAGLAIDVENGVVTVSGTIDCEDCGGLRTPGGIDNIQQSIGAVIRAVPGVESVEFQLN